MHIGTNSLSVLAEALTNGNAKARMEVAGAIAFLHEAAEPAVPALAECLRHESAAVRGNAIASLQAIPKRPDIVVPALVICLQDADDGVRCNAVTVIQKFGRDAEGLCLCLSGWHGMIPTPRSGQEPQIRCERFHQSGRMQRVYESVSGVP